MWGKQCSEHLWQSLGTVSYWTPANSDREAKEDEEDDFRVKNPQSAGWYSKAIFGGYIRMVYSEGILGGYTSNVNSDSLVMLPHEAYEMLPMQEQWRSNEGTYGYRAAVRSNCLAMPTRSTRFCLTNSRRWCSSLRVNRGDALLSNSSPARTSTSLKQVEPMPSCTLLFAKLDF